LEQSYTLAVNEYSRFDQRFSDGRVHRPTAAHPTFAEPRGTVTANQRRQPRSTHRCCRGRTVVDRIPNPRLAGSCRYRVQLPYVQYDGGVRPTDRAPVGSLDVALHDIVNRQLLRDVHVCGSRVLRQKVSNIGIKTVLNSMW